MTIPENFISVPLKINGVIPEKPTGNNFICDFCRDEENKHTEFKTWDELAWHITTNHNDNYKKDPKKFMEIN